MGDTYVHISDLKNCFNSPSGKFDLSRSKSVSLCKTEVHQLVEMLAKVNHYDLAFYGDRPNLKVELFFSSYTEDVK